MTTECYFCHLKTVKKLVEKFDPPSEIAQQFIYSVHDLLGEHRETINPELACYVHRSAREILNVGDLYADEKKAANQLLFDKYDDWHKLIDQSANPFARAAKLAVIGNIIDYGAHTVGNNIVEQINDLLRLPIEIDETYPLQQALAKAESVLYLGDNAGEIVFDRLFIETIQHPNLTYATRGQAVINDITRADADCLKMGDLCQVIDNGYDAPSTLLQYCSQEFLDLYHSADLIISKGQGNFEGLMNEEHPNTFFMLIAKCTPIAELLGANKNDMIIKRF